MQRVVQVQWFFNRLYKDKDHKHCHVPKPCSLCVVDEFSKKTRLQQVRRNGDLQISGEITDYTQANKSVSADGYSSQVELKMTVNVRFVNNSNHSEDFERTFSASQTYDSSQPLTSVQDDLVNQMVKDITNQIFNATVANW